MGICIPNRLNITALALVLFAGEVPIWVLILDSFGRNVPPFNKVNSVFRTEWTLGSPLPIDLYEVSRELSRFDQSDQEAPFVNLPLTHPNISPI